MIDTISGKLYFSTASPKAVSYLELTCGIPELSSQSWKMLSTDNSSL